MKIKIPLIFMSFILLGCSSQNQPIETKQTDIKTEDAFYHALIGNLMEETGQNNNAIAHYEELINDSYDNNVAIKLIPLYLEKNDFVGIKKLLTKINKDNISTSFKDYIIAYELLHNKQKEAIHIIKDDLNNLNLSKKESFLDFYNKRISFYKSINTQLNIAFQKNEINKKTEFLNELKKLEPKYYNMFNYINNKTLNNNKLDLFHNDNIILKYDDFIKEKNIEDLSYLIKNNVDFESLQYPTQELFTFYLESNNYEGIEKIHSLFNNNSVFNQTINYYNFIAKFSLFKNNDALVILQKIKNDLDANLFNYYSGLLNYRFGYKSATKRYFEKIDDLTLIKSISSLYINVMSPNNIDYLESNVSDAEYYAMLLQYYIDIKDLTNSKLILDKLNSLDITNSNIAYLNLIYDYLNNSSDFIEKLNLYYKHNLNDPVILNFYAYILADQNKDLPRAYALINKIKNDNSEAYLDTKAFVLFKMGKTKKALDVYIDNNMLNSNQSEVQHRLYKIYKSLKNKKASNNHLKLYNQIKLK